MQGIKKGILELTNFILVNKSDGKNAMPAKRAKVDLELALNLIYQKNPELKPEILLISALEKTGISEFANLLFQRIETMKEDKSFYKTRMDQEISWFESELALRLKEMVLNSQAGSKMLNDLKGEIISNKISPFEAAHQFVKSIKLEDLK